MKKYICTICGYIYDESKGIPDAGIAPGTSWDSLPEDWVCPLCGASKAEFKEEGADNQAPISIAESHLPSDEKELTALELSAVCSNLAKGCEKQYKTKEAEHFLKLAHYFKSASGSKAEGDLSALLALVEKELAETFPMAKAVSLEEEDRGAMRALVWSEKVTRILKSLLLRYEKEGNQMLDKTGVYVCTICGFIYVGENPPELCPICKVPSWKFEKIEGGLPV
jgi:rubredoxin